MQPPITTPADAYAARLDLAAFKQAQRGAKRSMAHAEANAVLYADEKNAEKRAAQVVLMLASDSHHVEALEIYEEAARSIGAIEAGLARYAEERDDARADLRERELAQRLTEAQS